MEMKGITCCADCVYYSKRKHKCVRCNNVESDARKHFYDDCPLQDVKPVVPGHWIEETRDEGKGWYFATYFSCSNCNDAFGRKSNYCPNCGAKMDESE